jgi:hypothetical protein
MLLILSNGQILVQNTETGETEHRQLIVDEQSGALLALTQAQLEEKTEQIQKT